MPKADNLTPSCAVVTKSVSPNFLEPSGALQACNGTALPFYIHAYTLRKYINDYIRVFIKPMKIQEHT